MSVHASDQGPSLQKRLEQVRINIGNIQRGIAAKRAVENELAYRRKHPGTQASWSHANWSYAHDTTESLEKQLKDVDAFLVKSDEKIQEAHSGSLPTKAYIATKKAQYAFQRHSPQLFLLALASLGAYKYYQYRKNKACESQQADEQKTEKNTLDHDIDKQPV